MPQEKQIEKRTYQVSPEVKEIAKKVIAEHKAVDIQDAKIEYLLVYPNIAKHIAGRCSKTNKHTKFFSDFDFVIEMSGELWDALDVETKTILTLHELMHVKVTTNKDGETQYRIKDHDVKDFSYIISKHGIDWFGNLKVQMASVYDLDPADEGKITL